MSDLDGLDVEDLDEPLGDPTDREQDSAPIGGLIVNWRTLTPEDAPRAWLELRTFVEWLCTRHQIEKETVPNCWFKHGAIVEELSALHGAHNAFFFEEDSGLGPISFMERLSVAKNRLRDVYNNGCSNGHRDSTPRPWDREPDNWTEWTEWSHARAGRC